MSFRPHHRLFLRQELSINITYLVKYDEHTLILGWYSCNARLNEGISSLSIEPESSL